LLADNGIDLAHVGSYRFNKGVWRSGLESGGQG
jgi:hypothetical protein